MESFEQMSYRDPDLSPKWLSEAEWRSYNDRSTKYHDVDSRPTIRRLIEEVKKLREQKKILQEKLDKYAEADYQQLAEDEEWQEIQKAKLEARKALSKGQDKISRIAGEVSIPRLLTRKSAIETLNRIKKIVEE